MFAQPILVAREGAHEPTIERSAAASLRVYLSSREHPSWAPWLAGPFTKTVRRGSYDALTKAMTWASENQHPFAVCSSPHPSETTESIAVAFAPMRYADMPKQIARCQVSGTELPRYTVPLGSDSDDDPTSNGGNGNGGNGNGVVYLATRAGFDPGAVPLREPHHFATHDAWCRRQAQRILDARRSTPSVFVDESLSTGKAAAQMAHAVWAWALDALGNGRDSEVGDWDDHGADVIECSIPALGLPSVVDPGEAARAYLVHDSGLTEVEPDTLTAVAHVRR